ncbi:MAG: efflux RND transporter periplasmic adaptor subunit [Deltaproteobacteria bacterium]|nr:efflux RND transporter periplasmic adaptor subunit [Deltaproteobacteria bacterium]MBI3079731.1 efflux RND transporter periplasmic adaptor subunit [Deltaproteobacteria bacterium]
MRRKKVLVLALLALAALGGLAYAYFRDGRSEVRYRTTRVERGEITATITATGNVNAVTTVLVGSQVSGTIQRLGADYNSVVKKGQVIAQLDPATFQAQVSQARANLEAARAGLENARFALENSRAALRNAEANVLTMQANIERDRANLTDARRSLERIRELAQKDLVSRQELDSAQYRYDRAVAEERASRSTHEASRADRDLKAGQVRTAEAQVRAMEAQVKQARAMLDLAEENLAHTTIRSPVNGIVIARNVDVGQTVAASLQAPTLFTIAEDLSRMQVDTNVSEADIGSVRQGMPATFTVDAFPNEVFRGQVAQVRLNPTTIQNVVTYNAVTEVGNPDLKLRPGMTAQVTILVARKTDALRVPKGALRFQPAEARERRQAQGAVGDRPAGPPPAGVKGEGPGREGAGRAGDRAGAANQAGGAGPRGSRMRPGGADGAPAAEGLQRRGARVWVLGSDGRPQPVVVRTGISDEQYTEILDGELREGQEVIIAATGRGANRRGTGPSLPGLGGPRGGGGRL